MCPTAPERVPRASPGWWPRLSLRVRVTTIAAFAVAVGLGAAGALLVVSLRSGLTAGLDDAAEARAADAVSALARGDTALAVSSAGGDSSLVQVVTSVGQVLTSSPALAGVGVLASPTSGAAPPPGKSASGTGSTARTPPPARVGAQSSC